MIDKTQQNELPVETAAPPAVDYGRLRNVLKVMLEEQYREGDRIPSERKLAAEFNVSPATISRTLHGLARSGVVRRVRGSGTYLCAPADYSAAAALSLTNTSPIQNSAAPASLTGRTVGIIAELGELPSRPGEPEGVEHRIASAIEREVQSCGGKTRIIDTRRHAAGSEHTVLAGLLKNGVDSVVLIDHGRQADRWLPLLMDAHGRASGGLPLVLALINAPCEWPVDCVRIDDTWGTFEAAAYLLKQGHRRLGFLSPAQGCFDWADARAAAFHQAVRLWNSVNDTVASGTVLYAPEEFSPDKALTGMIAANDSLALQFKSRIEAQGIRVPEDVSLIGYDNIAQAASADLCTLDLPAEQVGIQAARLCRRRLENPLRDRREEVALKPILLIRASVQALPRQNL